VLGLVDAIGEMRRRDIELAHAGMQPLERNRVVGW
jgi:predicted translin family RNA/ssDNA-binding protein